MGEAFEDDGPLGGVEALGEGAEIPVGHAGEFGIAGDELPVGGGGVDGFGVEAPEDEGEGREEQKREGANGEGEASMCTGVES